MWKTILAGMWSHKRRLVGTSLAVVLGVAFLTASLASGDTMTRGFDDLFSEANAGTAAVVRNPTEVGGGEVTARGRVDAALADEIRAVDGVAAVAPIVEGFAQIVGADGDEVGGNGPPTVATNWVGDLSVNPWRLDAGRAPVAVPEGQPYEVVIDRAAAEQGDLSVGDRTTVLLPQPVTVTVVGLVTFGDVDSLGPTTYTAFAPGAAVELFGRPGEVTELRIAAVDGVSEEAVRDSVAGVLPDGVEVLTGTELTAEMMDEIQGDFLGFFKVMLLAFAGIALVVAAFSIHNTFSILIAQRTRESALLRAIGATRLQVLASVVAEAVAIGVVASAVGLATGYGLATGFKALMDSSGLDLGVDRVVMSNTTIATSALVGLVVTVIASAIPAIRASRVSPLEALRDSAAEDVATSKARAAIGIAVTGAGIATIVSASSNPESAMVLAGLGALGTLIGAVVLGPVVARPAAAVLGIVPAAVRRRTGRLARRNAMRNPRRTAASASALMVGTAVVAVFTTFGSSIKATIDDAVDKSFGGDLVIVTENFSGAGLSPQLAPAVSSLPEVETAVGLGSAAMTIDGDDPSPTVIDPAGLEAVLDVGVSEGSLADVSAGEIAISEMYAEDHGLRLGSTVTGGYADGDSVELTVAAVYESRINVGDVIVHPDDWLPHADQAGDIVVLIDLTEGVSEADGKAAIAPVAERHAAPDVQTRSEYVDSVAGEVDEMLFFVYGMLALAVLIAVMGIGNTLSLSIHERTRELGLLRAVGQTRAQVRSTVRWESVILAVFGTITGLALGTFLGWGLMRALAAQEGYGVFAAPVSSLAIVLALAALAGVLAAVRPARRAARLDILDAIAAE